MYTVYARSGKYTLAVEWTRSMRCGAVRCRVSDGGCGGGGRSGSVLARRAEHSQLKGQWKPPVVGDQRCTPLIHCTSTLSSSSSSSLSLSSVRARARVHGSFPYHANPYPYPYLKFHPCPAIPAIPSAHRSYSYLPLVPTHLPPPFSLPLLNFNL